MSSPTTKASAARSRQSKRARKQEAGGRGRKASKISAPDVIDSGTLSPPVDVPKKLGLSPIRMLNIIGTRQPIPGDGNCGYTATKRGAEDCALIEPGMPITEFRRGLYDFATSNYKKFCGNSRYTSSGEMAYDHKHELRVIDATGDSVADFRIDYKEGRKKELAKEKKKDMIWFSSHRASMRKARFEERIESVWKADVDFEDGCGISHYFDTNKCLCILALKYKHTFLSYQTGRNKSMAIAEYQSSTGFVTLHLIRGSWYSPPAGSTCIVHNGTNHYEYLKVRAFPSGLGVSLIYNFMHIILTVVAIMDFYFAYFYHSSSQSTCVLPATLMVVRNL